MTPTRLINQILTSVALLAICQYANFTTAHAQTPKDIKLSLDRASTIGKILSGEKGIPTDEDTKVFLTGDLSQLSYLIASPSIRIHDGVPVRFADLAMMPAGARTLKLQYVVSRPVSSAPVRQGNAMVVRTHYETSSSEIVPYVVDLEPGKYYIIESDVSGGAWSRNRTVNFTVREVTDQQTINGTRSKVAQILTSYEDYKARIVTAEDYANFTEWANNYSLEGTYSSPNGRMELRFEGDRFQVFRSNTIQASTTFMYGTYCCDNEIIILMADSIKTTTLAGNRSRPANVSVEDSKLVGALYYKFDGEKLRILGKTDNLTLPFVGEYDKRIGESPSLSSTETEESSTVTARGQATLDISWRVEDGVLIVTGQGDVPGQPTWSSVVDQYTSAVIGDGITSLGHHAFAMSKLTSIVIGENVTNIGTYGFFNCNDLAVVEIKNPVPPKVGTFVFMGTPIGKAKLIVPAGSKAAYQKSGSWKKFGSIEER